MLVTAFLLWEAAGSKLFKKKKAKMKEGEDRKHT